MSKIISLCFMSALSFGSGLLGYEIAINQSSEANRQLLIEKNIQEQRYVKEMVRSYDEFNERKEAVNQLANVVISDGLQFTDNNKKPVSPVTTNQQRAACEVEIKRNKDYSRQLSELYRKQIELARRCDIESARANALADYISKVTQ